LPVIIGGGIIGGGGPPVVQYVYIDGAHLRRAADEYAATYFGGDSIIMTMLQMSEQGCLRKYYYDCSPPRLENEPNEDFARRISPTENLFARLRRMEGYHVHLGETVGVGGKARQKGVDVQLTTHMLTHSFRGTVERAILIAGDGDFVPLVKALVDEGTYVTLMSRPSNTSSRLIDAADIYRPFDPFNILGLASEQFRQKHHHYMRWASAELVIEGSGIDKGLKLLHRGMSSEGTAQLYGEGEVRLFCSRGEGNWMHRRFPSQAVMDQYLRDLSIQVTWE